MRKNVFTTLALLIAVVSFSQTKVGAGVVYGSESDLGLGVKASFDISEKLKVSPSMSYFFTESIPELSTTMMSFDADAHYFFKLKEKFSVYPLIGINLFYTSVSSSLNSAYSVSSTDFGINLGGGLNYTISNKVTGFSEIKAMLNNGNQIVFSAGVMYSL
ncbi:outer membrane beta-barrel protein [Tenacibaculum larymnensis]|uniref:Porin family protein n=1 Tax=Tenacibaculum larymnensis TaxID=2878201 RepID=A0A9X4EXN7_9FLAO|nr:outer membrane beta-barrel protein [Tenacibaculum larymnensis]MDE1208276.1 porin family protein [Tenacibaculum larymnensis]